MKDITKRLLKILRSRVQARVHGLFPEKPISRLFKRTKNREKEPHSYAGDKSHSYGSSSHDRKNRTFNENTGVPMNIPPQVLEDLAVFELTPPSSLEEVKKVRNREIKKFHPDMHVNDPGKYETAKQIMQIYNAAYHRLEKYYNRG